MKRLQEMEVLDNIEIAPGVWRLSLACPPVEEYPQIRPGQFVGVYCHDGSRLLPRPISICNWVNDETGGEWDTYLTLVYRVQGAGTRELSHLKKEETVRVLGILGNGYDVSQLKGRKVLLIGGGIGAPPLLGLMRAIQEANGLKTTIYGDAIYPEQREQVAGYVTAILGYRTNQLFLKDWFEAYGNVVVATDDGSAGVHGTVIDAAKTILPQFRPDVICSCGPLPMLRSVKQLAEELRIPCYLSLEERMACGVGACLGCVTKTTRQDDHSKVHNARICTEGPVFLAEDVIL